MGRGGGGSGGEEERGLGAPRLLDASKSLMLRGGSRSEVEEATVWSINVGGWPGLWRVIHVLESLKFERSCMRFGGLAGHPRFFCCHWSSGFCNIKCPFGQAYQRRCHLGQAGSWSNSSCYFGGMVRHLPCYHHWQNLDSE